MFKEALRRPSTPSPEFHHQFPAFQETGKTRHSDPYKEFWRYLDLRQRLEPDLARQELRKILALNLRSLGEEMKGHHPHTSMLIKKSQGQLLFQRPEFFGGYDLRAFYLSAHEQIANSAERQRFKLENHQMIKLFDEVAKQLEGINLGADPENICHQLVTEANFVKTKLLITPQLAVLLPALQPTVGKKLEVYAAPQLMTVSPPSKVHNKGKTSFAWVNQAIYLPEINEFILQRDGLFSQYSQTEIARFLELGNQPLPKLNEAELLAFIQTLPSEFIQRHALAIFQIMISELGAKPVPPIPGAVPQMTIDLSDLVETWVQIFDWEIDHYANDPPAAQTTRARLREFNEKILHHLGTDTPINPQAAVKEYTIFYSQRNHALQPEVFATEANQRYAKINPVFGQVKLDLSLLECGVGTITGGFNSAGANLNFTELGSKVGFDQLNLVKLYEKRSLLDRPKFEQVAKKLGKNPDLFPTTGVCEHCGVKQYLGPCNWCLFCEIKDDWGINGELPTANTDSQNQEESNQLNPLFKPTAGITEVINDDIYMDYQQFKPHFSLN